MEVEVTPSVADADTASIAVTPETPAPSAEATTVENVEATTTDTPIAQGEAVAEPGAGDGNSPTRDTKAERRIGQLTSRAKAAEESNTALAAERDELQQQIAALKPPTLEEHDYDESKYQLALLEHASDKSVAKGQLAANTREARRNETALTSERVADVHSQVDAFKVKTPDYTESVTKLAALPNLANSVMKLPNTPEVYYALSKDLSLAAALEQMPEDSRLIELGRLSAEAAIKPVTASNAPPPVESAAGGDTAGNSDGYRDDMSMEEFDVWYDKQHASG